MLRFQCLGHNEEHVWLLTFSWGSSGISGVVARSVNGKQKQSRMKSQIIK